MVEGAELVYRGRAETGRFWDEWHALWNLEVKVSETRDLGNTGADDRKVVAKCPLWIASWAKGLAPIALHECRHTFASVMIAARVEMKALSTYLGHASITITYDRYGHLLPGSDTDAVERIDGYLARTNGGPTNPVVEMSSEAL